MKRYTFLTALLFVPLAVCHAAEKPPKPLAGNETDPRLHSDGKGWGLNKAKIADPAHPGFC